MALKLTDQVDKVSNYDVRCSGISKARSLMLACLSWRKQGICSAPRDLLRTGNVGLHTAQNGTDDPSHACCVGTEIVFAPTR